MIHERAKHIYINFQIKLLNDNIKNNKKIEKKLHALLYLHKMIIYSKLLTIIFSKGCVCLDPGLCG